MLLSCCVALLMNVFSIGTFIRNFGCIRRSMGMLLSICVGSCGRMGFSLLELGRILFISGCRFGIGRGRLLLLSFSCLRYRIEYERTSYLVLLCFMHNISNKPSKLSNKQQPYKIETHL